MHEKSVVEKMGYVQPFDIPFHVSSGSQPRRLNHILTQAVMPDEVRHDLLNVKQNGDEYYMTHRKERYIDKSVPLSSTVSRSNIKTFANTAHVSTVSQKAGNDKESLSQGHKMVDLARVWGYDIHEVFKYNLVEGSYLFDDKRPCRCSDKAIRKYQNKISGPLLDRKLGRL